MDFDPEIMKIFLEIHRDMPRQGPGDNASTRKAFGTLTGLPDSPRILDVGCGPGMQTVELAAISGGRITAVDIFPQYLEQLREHAERSGIAGQIDIQKQDMNDLDFLDRSFDLIWAEGSIYVIGFDAALDQWRRLLEPGGFLAATELSWIKPDPPDEVRTFFAEGYPAMRDSDANLEAITKCGYTLVDWFVLPDSVWWDGYYTPLEERLPELETRYEGNETAEGLLAMERAEIECFRKYSEYYGYVFYLMRR